MYNIAHQHFIGSPCIFTHTHKHTHCSGILGVRSAVALLLVKGTELGVLSEQDPALEPVRQGLADLVAGKLAGGDGEDVVELLERLLLGFCKN